MTLTIFWFRRDLRLNDNAGLYHALKQGRPVLPVFIFDTVILDDLHDKKDKRVDFIHRQVVALQETLASWGSTLHCFHNTPEAAFRELLSACDISAVYTNADYEPYARERDQSVTALLQKHNIPFRSFKDQVIFGPGEVLKQDGSPYSVFTPYSKKWKEILNDFHLESYPVENYTGYFHQRDAGAVPTLQELGFEPTHATFPSPDVEDVVLSRYETTRDIPALEHGTTRLGLHLRFGTISIRELARRARELSETFLNELIWREFFMAILWHYPRVVSTSYKEAYDRIQWSYNEAHFRKWCQGQTGYPIVDAGMRELNETGFMHNRVRMITASFLCKHLLIDWRWGEAYFAQKLLDYELSSNNGNWQWAAGTGCDAAPYFRIFNPQRQTGKFDPDLAYVRKWVPELDTFDYPPPMVDHTTARDRCLTTYKKALQQT